MTMLIHTTCPPPPLSQSLPPHFLHPGLQDGWTSHTVCAEFHGGVC